MDTVFMLILAAAAAYAFLGRDRLEQLVAVAHAKLPAVELRHVIGAALVAGLALVWSGRGRTEPTPAPGPAPDAPITLAGKFSPTPDASTDAARMEALFGEIADELEWDAMEAEPLYKNGVAFDELRVRAFDMSPCLSCGGCGISETNEGDCFATPFPACSECLWSQGIVLCP